MATKKLKSIKGRAVRVTRLDQCGVPVFSTAAFLVSHGFIQVDISEEMVAGDEYTQKNAWGEFCVNDKDPDIMKRVNVSVQFCEIDPDVLDIIGGATPVIVSGDTIGWTRGPNPPSGAWALEVWTKKAGQDACAGGAIEWGYFVVPFIKNGKLDGSLTIANAPLNITMVGEGYSSGGEWAMGPHGDNPMRATFPDGEMYGQVVTTVAPPAPTDGVSALFDKPTVTPNDVFPAEPTVTAQDATNAAKLAGLGYIAVPATAWTTGQSFNVGTFEFNWTGTAWAAGPHA